MSNNNNEHMHLYFYIWMVNKDTFYKREIQEIYNIHFNSLKYYKDSFYDAIFYISYEQYDKEIMHELEMRILDIGIESFKIIKRKDTLFHESLFFKEEIVNKLTNIDGLVFFGHTKGLNNIQDNRLITTNIKKWILGLYYFNLYDIQEIKKIMLHQYADNIGYCGIKILFNDIGDVWLPSGTFFILNPSMIQRYLYTGYIKNLPPMFNRHYAENFLPLLVNNHKHFESYKGMILYNVDMYNFAYQWVEELTKDTTNYKDYEKYALANEKNDI